MVRGERWESGEGREMGECGRAERWVCVVRAERWGSGEGREMGECAKGSHLDQALVIVLTQVLS